LALVIPQYTYEEIRARADQTLVKHHPSAEIPIPIEKIVEFGYDITIVPIPGLKQVHEIDAFIGKNLDTIHLDRSVFESRSPYRYRFSLAHELGHVELHREVYDQIHFDSTEEWQALLRQFPEYQRSALEFQAYDFAGLFLVPIEPLRQGMRHAIDIFERASEARGRKLDLKTQAHIAKPYVCTWLSKRFQVSDGVIDRRLAREGLWPPS
jgi:hypothetical protein